MMVRALRSFVLATEIREGLATDVRKASVKIERYEEVKPAGLVREEMEI